MKILSPEEQAFETPYLTHTTRDITGRYNVRLPFKDNCPKLGDTYRMALKRFLSLERSLLKNLAYKTQYQESLREYERLGHTSEIPNDRTNGC
jgi:hypothetical protein